MHKNNYNSLIGRLLVVGILFKVFATFLDKLDVFLPYLSVDACHLKYEFPI